MFTGHFDTILVLQQLSIRIWAKQISVLPSRGFGGSACIGSLSITEFAESQEINIRLIIYSKTLPQHSSFLHNCTELICRLLQLLSITGTHLPTFINNTIFAESGGTSGRRTRSVLRYTSEKCLQTKYLSVLLTTIDDFWIWLFAIICQFEPDRDNNQSATVAFKE